MCQNATKTDHPCGDHECKGEVFLVPAEPADPSVGLAALPARYECSWCLWWEAAYSPRDEVQAVLDARMMEGR